MQINRTFLNDFCNYFTFLRTTLRHNAAFLRTTTSVNPICQRSSCVFLSRSAKAPRLPFLFEVPSQGTSPPARCFVMNYEFIITLMALLIIFIQHIEFSTFAKFVNRYLPNLSVKLCQNCQ